MTQINMLNPRALDESGYIMESERSMGNSKIYRYCLEDSRSETKVEKAARSVIALFDDNRDLIPLFFLKSLKIVKLMVANRPYLVINGRAVILSKTPKADGYDIICTDFFSESLVDKPVQCEYKHTLEKKYAQLWIKKVGNVCPVGKEKHYIGKSSYSFWKFLLNRKITTKLEEMDAYEQERITSIKKRDEEQKKVNTENVATTSRHNTELATLKARMPTHKFVLVGGAGKAVIKFGGEYAKRNACKGSSCGLHSMAKKVPGASIVLGGILAVYRGYNGEPIRAIGELASGVSASLPGYGTIASMGIDGFLAGYDVYEGYYGELELDLSSQQIHETFGLDPDMKPTKSQIDSAFRKVSLKEHPDKSSNLGEMSEEEKNYVQAIMQKCKETLYEKYGYS